MTTSPMLEEYDNQVNTLEEQMNEFIDLAKAGREGRGSKQKALDSRKLSMKLATMLKDYRAVSIKNDKNK